MVRDVPEPLRATPMHQPQPPMRSSVHALRRHPPQQDWSQPALTRTWRTLSLMGWSAGALCAFAHWPLPAVGLCMLGLWAHAKRQACQG